MPALLLADEVYEVVGAAMEVYYQLGIGFLEAVYQEAIEIELAHRQIPFEAQKRLVIHYKGRQLQKEYVADLVLCNLSCLMFRVAPSGAIDLKLTAKAVNLNSA